MKRPNGSGGYGSPISLRDGPDGIPRDPDKEQNKEQDPDELAAIRGWLSYTVEDEEREKREITDIVQFNREVREWELQEQLRDQHAPSPPPTPPLPAHPPHPHHPHPSFTINPAQRQPPSNRVIKPSKPCWTPATRRKPPLRSARRPATRSTRPEHIALHPHIRSAVVIIGHGPDRSLSCT